MSHTTLLVFAGDEPVEVATRRNPGLEPKVIVQPLVVAVAYNGRAATDISSETRCLDEKGGEKCGGTNFGEGVGDTYRCRPGPRQRRRGHLRASWLRTRQFQQYLRWVYRGPKHFGIMVREKKISERD